MARKRDKRRVAVIEGTVRFNAVIDSPEGRLRIWFPRPIPTSLAEVIRLVALGRDPVALVRTLEDVGRRTGQLHDFEVLPVKGAA